MSQLLEYRKAAVQSASPIGLVIMMYDTMVGDLTGAIDAMQRGDIETRCAKIKHALAILQHLEGVLDMQGGGEIANKFSRFYSNLRSKMVEAQLKMQPQILREQIEAILELREAWQRVESPDDTQAVTSVPAPAYQAAADELTTSTWTA